MAGDNSDGDFGQGEAAEGEENEVLPNFLPQGDRPSPVTWDDRPYALADDPHLHIASQETRPSTPSRVKHEKGTSTYLEEAEKATERERNSHRALSDVIEQSVERDVVA